MLFYQIHVPRTGGSSLREYAEGNNISWISSDGHLSFRERTIPNDRVTVTALRCPIRQTLSVYNFWLKHPDWSPWPGILSSDASFSDWLRVQPDVATLKTGGKWHWIPNLYVDFFGAGHFDTAVQSIKSINHVLDTSYLTEQFNAQVVSKYQLPRFNKHVNKSPVLEISRDDTQYIRKYREQDFEICRIFGIDINV